MFNPQPTKLDLRYDSHQRGAKTCDVRASRVRRGLSLLELTVSMGLLALIMIPVISLLSTSHKVMGASSTRQSGAYARHAALDAVGWRLTGCVQVVSSFPQRLVLRQADGSTATLRFSRGELQWETGLGVESLIIGLSNARFNVSAVSGSTIAAGELFLLEVATRGAGEPHETWSSTQYWIRPAI
jgi:hypothetical protein